MGKRAHREFRMIPDAELRRLSESEQIAYVRRALDFIVELNGQISRLLGYTDEGKERFLENAEEPQKKKY